VQYRRECEACRRTHGNSCGGGEQRWGLAGNRVPMMPEKSEAASMPCTTGPHKPSPAAAAASECECMGLASPLSRANVATSSAVNVRRTRNIRPTHSTSPPGSALAAFGLEELVELTVPSHRAIADACVRTAFPRLYSAATARLWWRSITVR
jgi:hypothetical protein